MKRDPIKFEVVKRSASDILARSYRDVQMITADCAVVLSDAKTNTEALSVAAAIRQMVALLQTQESAALLKADELCR